MSELPSSRGGVPERINSLLESEGGVVAHSKRFGMRLFNMMCERPPRLRRCGSFAAFYYCAATPALEQWNPLACQFIELRDTLGA